MAKSNNYIVYKHTFPNNKIYIGITCQKVNNRWRNGKGYKESQYKIVNAINKYGWENIRHEILFENLSKEIAEKKEIELIKLYKSNNSNFGYNIQNGGKTTGTLCDEIKQKISKSKKGKLKREQNPFYGKKYTEKTKKLISEYRKGLKLSEQTKTKISNSNKIKIVQFNKNNDFLNIWDSAKNAGETLNICNTSITACCKGKRKTAGKYIWKYYGDVYG